MMIYVLKYPVASRWWIDVDCITSSEKHDKRNSKSSSHCPFILRDHLQRAQPTWSEDRGEHCTESIWTAEIRFHIHLFKASFLIAVLYQMGFHALLSWLGHGEANHEW